MASDAVVNLVVDATGADSDINVQLRRIVNDAEASAPAINLTVRVDNDFSSVTDSLDAGFADLSAHLNGLRGEIGALSRDAGTGLRDVQSATRDTDNESNRLLDTFGRIAGAAGSLLGAAVPIAGIGVAAGGAVPLVAGLVTSLTNIAPAAAAGVTAFVTMKAAALTLKLGLTGVEDALKAVFDPDADPEAVAKALERLSPEARKFVGVLQDMKPAFDELRLDVQDRLFRNLDESVQAVGKSAFPIARAAALEFAGSFNTMGRNVAGAASILSKEGTLGAALTSGTDAFKELEDVPGQVVLAIGRLAAAGGPLLNRFADSISGVVDRLSTGLADAAESGGLEDAVNAAGDAIAQLGRIGGNVFAILGNVLGVAGDQGDGLFGSLERITQTLEDVTAAKGFQDTLTSLMDVAGTLAANILPLVGAAFEAIGPIVQALDGPVQIILNSLGREMLALMPQVAPILEQVATSIGFLLSGLEPLIPVLFSLVSALLPVLPPLFQAVNDIILALTPVITAVVVQLAEGLVPIIQDLLPVVVQLIEFLAEWITVTAPLAEQWIPLLVQGALFLTGVVAGLASGLLPLITVLLDTALTVAGVVVPALISFIDWVGDTNHTLSGLVNGGVRIAREAISAFGDLLTGDFAGAWHTITGIIGVSGSQIRSTVASMVSSVVGYVRGLGSDVINSFSVSFRAVSRVVGEQLGNALATVRSFGSSVLNTIRGFSLYQSGAALISGFISGILSQIGRVRDAASSVVSAARDYFPFSPAKKGAFSGRGWTRYSGQSLIRDFNAGINDQLRGFAINWGQVTDPVLPAFGNLNQSAVSDAGAVSTLFNTAFARVTPAVNVYLGNELLTERVQVQIDESNTQRDRLTSQGTRF